MTNRGAWIAFTICIGCGNNPGTSPDAGGDAPPDANGPPVLVCDDPDVDAPVAWNIAPVDGSIGVDPLTPLTIDLADGCGIDMASLVLRINGVSITPAVTGDAKNLRVEYAPPPGGFAKNSIIAAELHAADSAGNGVDKSVRFRMWDDYSVYLRAIAGIDSTTPATPVSPREWYHVETAAAAGQRLLGRVGFNFETPAAGVKFVTAHLHACARGDITDARTVAVYRLMAGFDHTTATWLARTADATWASSGADAVPADRDATPFATLVFQPAPGQYWTATESGDIAPIVQSWYDAPATNFGYMLVGAPGNVDINNGNCPMRITGFFGRPLPPL